MHPESQQVLLGRLAEAWPSCLYNGAARPYLID
jgi:hypothetical protein